jgi:hypothetical protein
MKFVPVADEAFGFLTEIPAFPKEHFSLGFPEAIGDVSNMRQQGDLLGSVAGNSVRRVIGCSGGVSRASSASTSPSRSARTSRTYVSG